MNKQLLEIINNLKGSLLGIGLNDGTYLDAIENNDDIHTCYILSNLSLTGKKFSMAKHGRSKKINIKKIKKHFKKKSLDNIICNYDIIKQFQRSLVPNSIYLNSGYLYIYGSQTEIESLKQKYQRYTNKIKINKFKDGFIMKINNQNTKNNFFKDIIFKIKDLGADIIDFITELLINWKGDIKCTEKKIL